MVASQHVLASAAAALPPPPAPAHIGKSHPLSRTSTDTRQDQATPNPPPLLRRS